MKYTNRQVEEAAVLCSCLASIRALSSDLYADEVTWPVFDLACAAFITRPSNGSTAEDWADAASALLNGEVIDRRGRFTEATKRRYSELFGGGRFFISRAARLGGSELKPEPKP